MIKTRKEKEKIIKKIRENLKKCKVIYFIDFKGLKGDSLFKLRRELKKIESVLYVAKKRLIKLVFQKTKISLDAKVLEGQVALVFGLKDEIALAKAIYEFQQTDGHLKILGGFVENESMTEAAITRLAQLPSKEVLLRRLLNSLESPIFRLNNIAQANIKGLLYLLKTKVS